MNIFFFIDERHIFHNYELREKRWKWKIIWCKEKSHTSVFYLIEVNYTDYLYSLKMVTSELQFVYPLEL